MTDQRFRLRVQCAAESGGGEVPEFFYMGDKQVAVVEIIDRWLASDHGYFKVRGDDGGVYIIRHQNLGDWWELTLFDSGAQTENRLSST